MTLLEEGLERGSHSVPGVSNPVEDMGFCPIPSAKVFFLFLYVVDYGLGSLSHMLRRHIATCIAAWGRPTACPKLRAYLANYLCTVQFW